MNRDLRDETGSTSFLTIGIVITGILLAALIVDAAAIRSQRRLAADAAQQAARAGAQQIDESTRLTGTIEIDVSRAQSAANAVIAEVGAQPGAIVVSADEITVTAIVPIQATFLPIGGDATATRTAQATQDQ